MAILIFKDQQIEQRDADNYVNATQMSKVHNKELKDFNRSEFAQKYLKALQESESVEITLTVSQGFPATKTTWFHPLYAIAFAQWISPEFHVWCNKNIKTLMEKGEVKLEQPKLTRRQIAEQLLEAEIRLEEAEAKLLEQAPKVAVAEAIGESKHPLLGEVIKAHGIGRNTGFERLRDLGVIQKHDALPYQKYIDVGYFEVKYGMSGFASCRVTNKGVEFVVSKLREWENRESIVVQVEKLVNLV